MEVQLGQKVKDKITGFEGIVVARCEYLNGCIQYQVKPKVNEKNESSKEQWIDDQQLEVISDGILIPQNDTGGGFRSHP